MPTPTLAQLKSELLTDPNGYGYAAAVVDMQAVGYLITLPRAAILMPRPDINPLEILEAINVQDFITAANQTILHGSWFESLTQFPLVRILKADGSDARTMTNLMRILVNG